MSCRGFVGLNALWWWCVVERTECAMSMWRVSDNVHLKDVIKNTSNHIGQDWPTLARCSGMSKTDIDSIRHNYRDNLVEQIAQFFIHWERQNGEAATAQALVDSVVTNLPHSDVFIELKKSKLIERRGLGSSIMDSSPTQTQTQRQSSVPVQESSPTQAVQSLFSVQETQKTVPKPLLMGIVASGVDAEVDNIQEKSLPKTDSACGSPLTSSEDEEKRQRRITRLIRIEYDKTGDSFDENSVIKTDGRYGVVKCRILSKDQCLMAGIELEEPVPGGGNGVYEGERHFSCDEGYALFVPYSALQVDTRFISEDLEDKPTPVELGILTEDSTCKLPGCNKPRYKEEASGKVLDYCGKSHAAHHQLLQGDTDLVSITSPQEFVKTTIVIPQDRVGLVIGRRGKNIVKLQGATNTSIQISDSTAGRESEAVIIGSPENCTKAIIQIMECIKEKTAMHTATTRTITMPNSAVGRVIGRRGISLQYIKAETDVQDIEFDKPKNGMEAVDPNCLRTCSITGSDEQIEKAIILIKQAQSGENVASKARFAAMFANLGIQIKDDSDAHAEQCVIS